MEPIALGATLLCLPIAPVQAAHGITQLTRDADIVLVGSVSRARTSSAGALLLWLAPERVLEGRFDGSVVAGTPQLDLEWESDDHPYGLWFLKTSGDGFVSVLPRATGDPIFPNELYFPLPRGDLPDDLRYAATVPIIDKVAAELLAGARVADAREPLGGLGDLLRSVEERRAHVAGGAHDGPCLWAKAYREGQALIVSRVEQELASSHPARLASTGGLSFVDDPVHVPRLAALLDAYADERLPGDVPRLKQHVAHALANIHSDAALPILASLLGETDTWVRFFAVAGLAANANGLPQGPIFGAEWSSMSSGTPATRAHVPNLMSVEDDPERFVSFWRSWWECEPCRRDHTPPKVVVTNPRDGSVLREAVVVLRATADDDTRLGSVRFFVDDLPLQPVFTEPPFETTWETSAAEAGVHTITAEATDLAGNVSTSSAVSVTLGATPPLAIRPTP